MPKPYVSPERLNGAQVRRVRIYLGLTQRALGRLLGVPQSTVQNWERGVRGVRQIAVQRLLDVSRRERMSVAVWNHIASTPDVPCERPPGRPRLETYQ